MALSAQQISYQFPNGKVLFKNLSFNLGNEKTGLVGPNGCGKSTLLQLIAKTKSPTTGKFVGNPTLFKQPQSFLPFYSLTVSQVLGIDHQLTALKAVLAGKGSLEDFTTLNDRWDLESEIQQVLEEIKLEHLSINRKFETLSGGEMSRILFARILLQEPEYVLLDEPTNHLDKPSRAFFNSMVSNYKKGMLIVSHDKNLLRQMDQIFELSSLGLSVYGGNFDFYQEQKAMEEAVKKQALQSAELGLKKKIFLERKQQEDAQKRQKQGKKDAIKANLSKDVQNYFKNRNERTSAKLKKTRKISTSNEKEKIIKLKAQIKSENKITIDLSARRLPNNKRVLHVEDLNFAFPSHPSFWIDPLNFTITGPQRWCISGPNGSGKTTLLQIILGKKQATSGHLLLGTNQIGFLDQKLDLLDLNLSIYENINRFNHKNIEEGEIRKRLARFLFPGDTIYKKAKVLSGGERMRLGLACLFATDHSPDLLILDEPTNNLDMESTQEVIDTLSNYKGALIVVSHDEDFLKEISIDHELVLSKNG